MHAAMQRHCATGHAATVVRVHHKPRGEPDGAGLIAGNLIAGELAPVKALPCFSMSDRWGRLTLGPCCQHLWVCGPGVPSYGWGVFCFSLSNFDSNFKNS